MRFQMLCVLLVTLGFNVLYAQHSRVGEIPNISATLQLIALDGTAEIDRTTFLANEKPIAIFFWLSTCGPCIKELNALKVNPELAALRDKVTLMVVSDDPPKNYAAAWAIANKYKWDFDLYFDKGYVLRKNLLIDWYGVPQVMVLDQHKKITLHKFGYRKSDEVKVIKHLQTLLP